MSDRQVSEALNAIETFIESQECNCSPEIEIDSEERKCARCSASEELEYLIMLAPKPASPEFPQVTPTTDEWEQAIHKAWASLPKASGREPDYGYYKVGFYDGAKWMQDQDTESRTSPSRLQTETLNTKGQDWAKAFQAQVEIGAELEKRIADLEGEQLEAQGYIECQDFKILGLEKRIQELEAGNREWIDAAKEHIAYLEAENERLKRALEETQIGHSKTQSGNGDE